MAKKHDWVDLGLKWWEAYFRAYGLPCPTMEHVFHPTRKWALDLAWPDLKVGVEINGGIMSGLPSHTGKGHLRDMEKINAAQALGWVIVQVTPQQVKSADLISLVEQVMSYRRKPV